VSRQPKTFEDISAEVGTSSPSIWGYHADLAKDGHLETLKVSLKRECPSIDALIHCAGVLSTGEIADADVKDLDWQYRVNVRAPYVLTQALLPLLKSSHGQVIFINSSAGLIARASVGQYAATKHALKAIADSLREETNSDGVRVLSLFLGRTASPMQARLHEVEGREYRPEDLMQPDDVASIVIHALSMPRTAEVTDINIRPLKKGKERPICQSTEDRIVNLASHQNIEAMIVRDLDGTIRYWSREAEIIYGWTPDEVIGRRSHHVFRTQFPFSLATIEKEVHEKKLWQGQLVHRRRDGSRIAVQSRWHMQRNPRNNSFSVIEVNATTLIQAA
jgi:PAS domain S-box-containing protein